jgi:ATP-dependent DNA helicase RecG
VDEILKKINNLTMRELPGGTLFPDTMKQYDDYTIREALHNCIAHQDYRLNQRINFVETPDYLFYSNAGTFIPGTIEEALEYIGQRKYYRNECLCQAMVNFNMIDTISRGIKTMYAKQRERHFPMPDFQIDNNKQEVNVKIYGKVIDERYAKLLASGTQLSLKECIWLDAIQKKKIVTPAALEILKARKLIEGRAPNYFISLAVAKKTKQLGEYTRMKGLERDKYLSMIYEFVKNGSPEGVMLNQIFDFMNDALPKNKDPKSQKRFLGHLIFILKDQNKIDNKGKRWIIAK